MRSRNIKPGFFKNEILATLPAETRLLFIGLWTMADREGRLEDRPARIKAELFPYEQTDVEKSLAGLAENKFISRYAVSGSKYIQILNFEKHQRPHPKEQPSTIPKSGKSTPKSGKHTPKSDKPELSGLIPSNPLILPPDIPPTLSPATPKKHVFVPPTVEEVVAYFVENGFQESVARRAFKGYAESNWHDSRGSPIKNWRQKMVHVWFKDEHKSAESPKSNRDAKFGPGHQIRKDEPPWI